MRDRAVLARFAGRRVVVLGDAILDTFVVGEADRLCREQPVPVLTRREQHELPGGAANVAANLATLGAEVRLVAALGDDAAGALLTEALAAAGVATTFCGTVAGGRTPRKMRVLAGEHYLARVDDEPLGFEALAVAADLATRLAAALVDAEGVVVADYLHGVVGAATLRALARERRRRPLTVVVDGKEPLRHPRLAADALAPNLEDAARAVGLPVPDPDDARALRRLGEALLRRTNATHATITLGSRGVAVAGRSTFARIDGRRIAARNACGAGDSFTATLTLGLCAGAEVRRAARVALEAAAVAVAKPFTATVGLGELDARLALLEGGESRGGTELRRVTALVRRARARGQRIVFTNGVFDLLHDGHVRLLQRARAQGDVLIVAINGDASARAIKGPDRPINDQHQRRAVLAALGCVDDVVVFHEPTAERVLERLRPDVYVRGDDRPVAALPEAAVAESLGARVVILERIEGRSGTAIIDRVTARSPFWRPSSE